MTTLIAAALMLKDILLGKRRKASLLLPSIWEVKRRLAFFLIEPLRLTFLIGSLPRWNLWDGSHETPQRSRRLRRMWRTSTPPDALPVMRDRVWRNTVRLRAVPVGFGWVGAV